jgi:hypothetical protein
MVIWGYQVSRKMVVTAAKSGSLRRFGNYFKRSLCAESSCVCLNVYSELKLFQKSDIIIKSRMAYGHIEV